MEYSLNAAPHCSNEGHSGPAILTASVGLGTYTPAVYLYRAMYPILQTVYFFVLEDLYSEPLLERLMELRGRFRRDFKYALMAQRSMRLNSPAHSVDEQRAQRLLSGWKADGVNWFIVFSGFWLPLLERYRLETEAAISVDCVQTEAVLSPSWRRHLAEYSGGLNLIWLFTSEPPRMHKLLVPPPPGRDVGDSMSSPALVVHGGGWHIGDYKDAVKLLSGRGYDVTVVREEEPRGRDDSTEDCWIDPAWEPWARESPGFPPMRTNSAGCSVPFFLHEKICRSAAIVSKPGGATLIESMLYGVPLVFLEPFGPSEEKNAELWTRLGAGLSFEAWRKHDFDAGLLNSMRHAIECQRKSLGSYFESTVQAAPVQ